VNYLPSFGIRRLLLLAVAGTSWIAAWAQLPPTPQDTTATPASQSLPAAYQHWLNEDVRWIITPDELAKFNGLTTDEERDTFVMQFWLRRDPTPDTEENELKEEHYRRIAFSNEHYAAHTVGSLTDRGRVYIKYGPPDAITHQPGTSALEPPKEVWHFEAFSPSGGLIMWEGKQLRNLNRVDLVFVDDCRCNDYRLQTPEPK